MWTNNICLSASLWFWKLPSSLSLCCPFHFLTKSSLQSSGPIHQPVTGWDRTTDQRADIWDNGLTGRLQCMRRGWIATEREKAEKERTEGGSNAHTNTHILPELYGGYEMEILADFAKGEGAKVSSLKTLLESSIPLGLSDWLVQLRFSIQVCFPRGLQLFFSSCKVIWWKINPTFI